MVKLESFFKLKLDIILEIKKKCKAKLKFDSMKNNNLKKKEDLIIAFK